MAAWAPWAQGLFQAGLGALQASGPSETPTSLGQILASAGATGVQGWQDATEQARQLRQQKMQDQLSRLQLEQAKRQARTAATSQRIKGRLMGDLFGREQAPGIGGGIAAQMDMDGGSLGDLGAYKETDMTEGSLGNLSPIKRAAAQMAVMKGDTGDLLDIVTPNQQDRLKNSEVTEVALPGGGTRLMPTAQAVRLGLSSADSAADDTDVTDMISKIDVSKLTPDSRRRLLQTGDTSNLEFMPEADQNQSRMSDMVSEIDLMDLTPESRERFSRTGDLADVEYRPEALETGGADAPASTAFERALSKIKDPELRTRLNTAYARNEAGLGTGGAGGMNPEAIEARGEVAKGTFQAQEGIAAADRMKQAAQELLRDPNLESVTGPIQSNLPSYTSAQSNVRGRLDNLKNQIALNAIATMRAASPTGGALGDVTGRELTALQNSIASLNDAQSDEEVRRSLRKVVQYTNDLQGRIRQSYETTYGNAEALGTGGGPTVDIGMPQPAGDALGTGGNMAAAPAMQDPAMSDRGRMTGAPEGMNPEEYMSIPQASSPDDVNNLPADVEWFRAPDGSVWRNPNFGGGM